MGQMKVHKGPQKVRRTFNERGGQGMRGTSLKKQRGSSKKNNLEVVRYRPFGSDKTRSPPRPLNVGPEGWTLVRKGGGGGPLHAKRKGTRS